MFIRFMLQPAKERLRLLLLDHLKEEVNFVDVNEEDIYTQGVDFFNSSPLHLPFLGMPKQWVNRAQPAKSVINQLILLSIISIALIALIMDSNLHSVWTIFLLPYYARSITGCTDAGA